MHGLRHVLEQAQKNGVAVGRSSGRITESMLKLAEANRAIVAAQVYARDHGYSISVTVCDSMGYLIAHQRMDDALLGSRHGSVGKAIASAGLGIPSGQEFDVDLGRSSVSGVIALGLPIIRRAGGLPIKRGGEVEGGIGVSGASTNEQDEECAHRGLKLSVRERSHLGILNRSGSVPSF